MARSRSRAGRPPDAREAAHATRIHGDRRGRAPGGGHGRARPAGCHGTRIHGDARGRGGGRAPATRAGRALVARTDLGAPTGSRLRAALRLVVRATRRFVHVAGHAATASVATTHPRPLPAHSGPAGARRRYAAKRGPGAPVLVIGALMALIVAMLGVERVTGVAVLPEQLFAGIRPPPKKFPVLPESPPTGIAIRKLDLRAPVHRVGLAPDGSIAVPELARAGEAGWYEKGPTPGQYGPAVIVGHVDTTTGPAVFHELKRLDDGDRVEVTREDGSVAVFEVTSVRRYGKERLPVDEIYGDFSRPNLRLITCGGRWVGGETGYADNLVVYASLVQARGP